MSTHRTSSHSSLRPRNDIQVLRHSRALLRAINRSDPNELSTSTATHNAIRHLLAALRQRRQLTQPRSHVTPKFMEPMPEVAIEWNEISADFTNALDAVISTPAEHVLCDYFNMLPLDAHLLVFRRTTHLELVWRSPVANGFVTLYDISEPTYAVLHRYDLLNDTRHATSAN